MAPRTATFHPRFGIPSRTTPESAGPPMDTLKFAFRALLKSPGFTLVAIVALALGIGASSAIFSIINALFLRPLPYTEPERIVQLTSSVPEQNLNQAGFSWPRLQAVREQKGIFSDVAASVQTAFIVTGTE